MGHPPALRSRFFSPAIVISYGSESAVYQHAIAAQPSLSAVPAETLTYSSVCMRICLEGHQAPSTSKREGSVSLALHAIRPIL